MPVRSLGQEDPLEEGMATHSSILAWRIPWRVEPGRLQSMGSKRVGHDWSDLALKHTNGSTTLTFTMPEPREKFRWWIWHLHLNIPYFKKYLTIVYIRNQKTGTSLVVQWWRLCASTAGSMGSIPGWRMGIPHAMWHEQKIKKKKTNPENFFRKRLDNTYF